MPSQNNGFEHVRGEGVVRVLKYKAQLSCDLAAWLVRQTLAVEKDIA